MAGPGEFEFIRSKLAPLSAGAFGAADLTDDGAVLDLGPGERLAVTADTLVEGRHFPIGEDAGLAARKALRVNLSDLAAMGAKPFGYTLGVIWPRDGVQERADGFVAGLAQDQAVFGVRLFGGDTVVADAPWSIAVTAFGRLPAGSSLRRNRARAGDALIVTGTIGDAGLGLQLALGEYSPSNTADADQFRRRFQLPEPRIGSGLAVRGVAHAAIDISDGLLSEARHLAVESGLGFEIDLEQIPLSAPARRWLDLQPDRASAITQLASSGDDYELLLAVPSRKLAGLSHLLRQQEVPVTQVGQLTARDGDDPVIVTWKGRRIEAEHLGFTQF